MRVSISQPGCGREMPAGFLEASMTSEFLCMDAFPFPPGGAMFYVPHAQTHMHTHTHLGTHTRAHV